VEPNEEQLENLRLLAQYLRKSRSKFDMEVYAALPNNNGLDKDLSPDQVTQCGTVCCAAGSGPKLAKKYTQFEPLVTETDWRPYIERVYGVKEFSSEWYWMFGYGWYFTDNTRLGAAKRIEWYLENGVPDDWGDQMHGEVPLVYK
jgi:hypothetical protein